MIQDKILDLAISQGMWPVLAVVLIFYNLKHQEKRDVQEEERGVQYQKIITNLTEKLTLLEVARKDISDIKEFILKK